MMMAMMTGRVIGRMMIDGGMGTKNEDGLGRGGVLCTVFLEGRDTLLALFVCLAL